MKKRMAALALAATMLLSACENSEKAKDLTNEHSIDTLVNHNDLKDLHELDEIFQSLTYNIKDDFYTIYDFEEFYFDAINQGDEVEANLMVSRILKMIICAKISEATGLDAQMILNDSEMPTIEQLTDSEKLGFITINEQIVYVPIYEEDQFNRLVLSYANAVLASNGYECDYSAEELYEVGKESILASEKVRTSIFSSDDEQQITSDFDSEKIKCLSR